MTMYRPADVSAEQADLYRRRGYWGAPKLGVLLREHAREAPHRLAVADEHGRTVTYRELDRAVDGAVGWFSEHGVGVGDSVVISLPNIIDYVVAYLALSRLGAVSVLSSPREGPADVAYVTDVSRAKLVMVPTGAWTDRYIGALAAGGDHAGAARLVAVDEDGAAAVGSHGLLAWPGHRLLGERSVARLDADLPDDIVDLIAFSSGTTGRAKGIAHTHDSAMASLSLWIRVLGLSWRDPVFCPATMGHVAGTQWGLRLAVFTGAPLILMHRWDPRRATELIGEYGCVYSLVTPTYIHDLCSLDAAHRMATDRFQFWTVAGARMDPDFVRRSEEFVGGKILRGYGMTEHFMSTLTRADDPEEKRQHLDGRALPGVELQIWGNDDTPQATGVPGEMVYRGPSLVGGYFTHPEETERVFQAGWQRTGDLAVMDAEGFISILDRIKLLIIRGGENISPNELENHLRTAPWLPEFVVVPAPDERLGERVALAVERPQEPVTIDMVCRHLEGAAVAKYKWPEIVVEFDELPRTNIGKIQRQAVTTMVAERLAGSSP